VRSEVLFLCVAMSIIFMSGCLNSAVTFDRSTATYQNSNLANMYTLSFNLPKDTVLNYYKDYESSKLGYNQYGLYMSNKAGRTDFFIYKLTAGVSSLTYLFGSSEDQFNANALENWNRRQLSSKGYNKEVYTYQSTTWKEIDGVKESRVIRTTAKDQMGNQMIVESCWFDYPNGFWFITTTWPTDYYDNWFRSDLILHYQR
jgi:hypothetical protein